jgi:hypothetical protein
VIRGEGGNGLGVGLCRGLQGLDGGDEGFHGGPEVLAIPHGGGAGCGVRGSGEGGAAAGGGEGVRRGEEALDRDTRLSRASGLRVAGPRLRSS